MKVLVFTGAGASVELGVPTMRPMVEQFRDHLHDLALPSDVVGKIDRLVGDGSKDMEHAIDVIDRLERGYDARIELGEGPAESEIAPYRTIRQEAEWFVQHCCEQIKSESAVRMWLPVLRATSNVDLTIASTNYDRAVEIAASRLSLALDDGFEEFSGREIAHWHGLGSTKSVQLLKLHGSTDWYRGPKDEVLKLRHPMPLFGTLKVLLGGVPDVAVQSALVLPSREKVVTLPPFQELAAEFRQRAKASDVAIFVGSSLRDPHMRDVCVACARSKPTYIVSRTGEFEEGAVPAGAVVLRQSAGRFLVSTLPTLLRERDPAVLLNATQFEGPDKSKVLAWLVTACDESVDVEARCAAVEDLANERISLSREDVLMLLHSRNADVSMFGLGLIPASIDRKMLLNDAHQIRDEKQDPNFTAELGALASLMLEATH